ncbi:MAG: nitrous oxide reductase accessory protein NosL [Planctomycetota bacterium]|nr:nitrous oxide reductase accessory protein NosL [Planctomycetota bacterium]
MIGSHVRQMMIPFIIPLGCAIGCEQRDPLAPPQVHYGQDICDVCGMIISDERYAAAAIVGDEHHEHHPLLFDDIGCLLVYEDEPHRAPIAARYVKGYETRRWLALEDATFVHSAELHSPMAFGAAACASKEAADTLEGRYAGDILTAAALRDRFDAGMLHIDPHETADGKSGHDHRDDDESFAVVFDPERARRVEAVDSGEAILLATLNGPERAVGRQPFVLLVGREEPEGGIRPVDDLVIRIEPSMPSMGHGSHGNVHPRPTKAGVYEGRINLTMPGRWVVHVTLRRDGDDIAYLNFELQAQRS